MTMATRKDVKGRKLKEGESYRSDGRYVFRFYDERIGMRRSIYARDLTELREKEALRNLDENIIDDATAKKRTLKQLFERYMATKTLSDTTEENYRRMWRLRVKDTLGNRRIINLRSSDVKAYYLSLSKDGLAKKTIKYLHSMITPALELAVEDNLIRKNPARNAFGDYGKEPKKREALTQAEPEKLLSFVTDNNCYRMYLPMLTVMLGTAIRCGELIGLTWDDISTRERKISIDHQLIYRNFGNGCEFRVHEPKTEAGVRMIPMTSDVRKAFNQQREQNFMLGIDRAIEIDGKKGFIFTSKNGYPMMPSAVNNVLYNIVKAYNRHEMKQAVEERRDPCPLPTISAHILRHTGCTRMAESGMDVKLLQYIMGCGASSGRMLSHRPKRSVDHADISVTLNIYTHLSEWKRIEDEFQRLERLAV